MCIRLAVAVAVLLVGASSIAGAQPVGKAMPRIGYLDGTSRSAVSVRIEAFRQSLRELGYVEGQNVAFASGDLRMARQTAYHTSPPSSSVSKLMSL